MSLQSGMRLRAHRGVWFMNQHTSGFQNWSWIVCKAWACFECARRYKFAWGAVGGRRTLMVVGVRAYGPFSDLKMKVAWTRDHPPELARLLALEVHHPVE